MGEVALMSPTLPSGITDSISDSHWRNSDEENILLSSADLSPFLNTVEQILVVTILVEIQRNYQGFHRKKPFVCSFAEADFLPNSPGPSLISLTFKLAGNTSQPYFISSANEQIFHFPRLRVLFPKTFLAPSLRSETG